MMLIFMVVALVVAFYSIREIIVRTVLAPIPWEEYFLTAACFRVIYFTFILSYIPFHFIG